MEINKAHDLIRLRAAAVSALSDVSSQRCRLIADSYHTPPNYSLLLCCCQLMVDTDFQQTVCKHWSNRQENVPWLLQRNSDGLNSQHRNRQKEGKLWSADSADVCLVVDRSSTFILFLQQLFFSLPNLYLFIMSLTSYLCALWLQWRNDTDSVQNFYGQNF